MHYTLAGAKEMAIPSQSMVVSPGGYIGDSLPDRPMYFLLVVHPITTNPGPGWVSTISDEGSCQQRLRLLTSRCDRIKPLLVPCSAPTFSGRALS